MTSSYAISPIHERIIQQFTDLARITDKSKITILGFKINVQSSESLLDAGIRWAVSDSRQVTADFLKQLVDETLEYTSRLSPDTEKKMLQELVHAVAKAIPGLEKLHAQYKNSGDDSPSRMMLAIEKLREFSKPSHPTAPQSPTVPGPGSSSGLEQKAGEKALGPHGGKKTAVHT